MKHTLAAGCGALLLTVLCAAQALAHPVAQGALAIDVRADQVTLRARVALEEAIVANAFGPAAARAETPVALRRSHAARQESSRPCR